MSGPRQHPEGSTLVLSNSVMLRAAVVAVAAAAEVAEVVEAVLGVMVADAGNLG